MSDDYGTDEPIELEQKQRDPKLKNTIKTALYYMWYMSALGLVAATFFFAGVIYNDFKKEQVPLNRVCNYCVGERRPQLLDIQRNELRVTCGKGDLERVGVLIR